MQIFSEISFQIFFKSFFCSTSLGSLISGKKILEIFSKNFMQKFPEKNFQIFLSPSSVLLCLAHSSLERKVCKYFHTHKWRKWCIYLLTHIFANILKVSLWLIDLAHCSANNICANTFWNIKNLDLVFLSFKSIQLPKVKILFIINIFINRNVGFVPDYICKGNLC